MKNYLLYIALGASLLTAGLYFFTGLTICGLIIAGATWFIYRPQSERLREKEDMKDFRVSSFATESVKRPEFEKDTDRTESFNGSGTKQGMRSSVQQKQYAPAVKPPTPPKL